MRARSTPRALGRRRRQRPAAAALALPALVAGVLLAACAPGAAHAGCITRLPVRVTLPDGPYAAGYAKAVRVQVNPRAARIRNLRAALYTFSGERMAVSGRRRAVRVVATLTLRLERIFRPLQVGMFTLVLTGEPNASPSCGPKQATRVLRFRACADKLPVSFPRLPGGRAADYRGWLSVPIRSNGSVIRDVRSSVFGFDGSLAGRARGLPALFGELMLDHPLARPLAPGGYTVVVSGLLGDQPRACGRRSATATMAFG
jgi:hypothetical protein